MEVNPTVFSYRVLENNHLLTKTEKKAAEYMEKNQEKMIYLAITELAEMSKTSEATIIRICRKLGYDGFQDLKISIALDLVTPQERIHEEIKPTDDVNSIIEKSIDGIIQTLTMTKGALSRADIEKATEAVLRADKIVIVGCGNSASISLDAQHKFMRIGLNVHAYSDGHMQMIAISSLGRKDVVIAISHSGSSKDIVDVLNLAKQKGATTISITSSGTSPVTKFADIRLFTYSQETKYRMYALTSRIASLSIIDAIYIGVVLKMGDSALHNFESLEKALVVKKY